VVILDQLVLLDHKEQLVYKELVDHRDPQVQQVQQEQSQDRQGLGDHRDLQAQQVQQEQSQDRQGLGDHRDLQAQQVQKDQSVYKVHKDLKDL